MDNIETAALVLFASWLFVTVLFQINQRGLIQRLKGYDYFATIPVWTFFAPNPGTTDTHLLYRDKLAGGQITRWREVPLGTTPLRVIWNPQKRFQKGLSDLSSSLHYHAAVHREHAESILTHTGFIALLNFITGQPHSASAVLTQFVVARSYGYHSGRQAEVVFLSSFHYIS
jgi:hypothetical protein